MTPLPEQMWKLLRSLMDRTERGELTWQLGSEDFEFMLALKKGSVVIGSSDRDGRYPHVLSILNDSGAEVESYHSVDPEGEGENWWSEALKLYESARRSALGSTQVVNELLAELEADDDDIPF